MPTRARGSTVIPPSFLITAEQAAEQVFASSLRHFYGLRKLPGFPKPVVIGPRALRSVRDELEQFASQLPRASERAEPQPLRAGRLSRSEARKQTPAPFDGALISRW